MSKKSIYELIVEWEKMGYSVEYNRDILTYDLLFPSENVEEYGSGKRAFKKKASILEHLLNKKSISLMLEKAFVTIYISNVTHSNEGTSFLLELAVRERH